MKKPFFKILFISGVMISAVSLIAQTSEHSRTTTPARSGLHKDTVGTKSKNSSGTNKANNKTREDKKPTPTKSASPGTNGPNSGTDPLGTGK